MSQGGGKPKRKMIRELDPSQYSADFIKRSKEGIEELNAEIAAAHARREANAAYLRSLLGLSVGTGAYSTRRKGKHKYDDLNERFIKNLRQDKLYDPKKRQQGLVGIPGEKGHAVAIIGDMLFNANDATYHTEGADVFTTPEIMKRYKRPLMERSISLHHDFPDESQIQGCCALIAGAILKMWSDKSLTPPEKMTRALTWSGQRLLETYSPL